jgi:hypothetical protein
VTIVAKPTFPEEERLTEAIILIVNQVVGGELSVEEGLSELEADMNEILP